MVWLTLTVSPGRTLHETISASVSPSPASGRAKRLTCGIGIPSARRGFAAAAERSVWGRSLVIGRASDRSVGEAAVHRVEQPVEVGQVGVLVAARRVGQVEA